MQTTRHASTHFRRQLSGVVINTGSDSGLGHYGNSLYAAAKEAIAGFTRTIARDLGPFGARCNMLRPCAISRQAEDTKIGGLILEAEQKYGFPSAGDLWVTKMMVAAEAAAKLESHHIADFATWLCTDEAAHLNGQNFRVMGGEISLMSDPIPLRSVFSTDRWDLKKLNDYTVASYLHKHLTNRFLPQNG
jgi:3-oxoacyl-[acyl-carrier protein] reductase